MKPAPVCELPMNPIKAMSECQDIARSHPELADRLGEICKLIISQNALVLTVHQAMRHSRLTEHFGCK